MSEKQRYIEFLNENRKKIPLFFWPEWWDMVCPHWDVVSGTAEGYFAFLPFCREMRYGFKIIRNPHFTPYSGLIFSDEIVNEDIRNALAQIIMKQLPKYHHLEIDCYPGYLNHLMDFPEKYTFKISLTKPLVDIRKNYKDSLQRQLKKAKRDLKIIDQKDPVLLYNLMRQNKKQQLKPLHQQLLSALAEWTYHHQTGKIFMATDEENQEVHSAIFVVHDQNEMYYLAGASDHRFLGSGSMGYLLDHCIEYAYGKELKAFDFEGSMIPGIARFFKTFNPEQYFYPVLFQDKSILYTMLHRFYKSKSST